MKQEIFLYMIGTAGSGKSTLSHTFKEWTEVEGLDAILVNLDPGAENLPYTPDVDIRDWISLKEVMETHGLGPNGAQIACADMLALNTDDVKESISSFKSDFVVVDTPGQLELFVFRESGRFIIETLQPNRSVIAYLIDHVLAKNPSAFVSHLLLSLSTHFRMGVPQLNILSKADMLTDEELEQVVEWSKNTDLLEQALMQQQQSLYTQINENILRLLFDFPIFESIIPVSEKEFLGVEDLYAMVQFLFEGGEDVRPD
jgi:GPN-loop GTPase